MPDARLFLKAVRFRRTGETAAARAGDGACLTFETLSLEAVRGLVGPHPGPCLSLYLPTHRTVPDNAVDLPSFRHLVGGFEAALAAAHPRHDIERLLQPFRRLASAMPASGGTPARASPCSPAKAVAAGSSCSEACRPWPW